MSPAPNSPMLTTDVLIVGAGPSGLVSALLLARLGHRCVVVERNAFTDDHPKAHELNARSVEILREIGITENKLAAEASPIEDGSRVLFCRTINEEYGRIDLMADPARREKYARHLRQTLPYFNLSQSEFEKLLVRRAEAEPLIDLRFRHRWDSMERRADGVVSRVFDENLGAPVTIASRYLLACDGAGSPVRRALGIGVDGPAEIQNFVTAAFRMNLRDRVNTPAKLYWITHPRFAGSLIAHNMERRWVYIVPYFKPWQKPEDFTRQVLEARIRGALGFDAPDLRVDSISTWRMTAQVARSYRDGRVFLVGDAAHRFPPTGGLGMNTGIADAHNLVWKLAAVLQGRAGDALLDTYEAERRPVAVKNCDESRRNFDKIMDVFKPLGLRSDGMELLARIMGGPVVRRLPDAVKQAIFRLLTAPADRMLKRVFRNATLKRRVDAVVDDQIGHFDRLGLDIGYTYETGALVDDGSPVDVAENEVCDYVPSTRPGARLPHAWIDTPGGRRSTHDLLAYDRFTLLATGQDWKFAAESLPTAVHFVDASALGDPFGLGDRPLLVRPDGHIAWRGDANGEADRAAALRDVLDRLGLMPANPEAVVEARSLASA